MSTTMQKTAEVKRDWYILDAAGKPLGRVATIAAHILRGKHKPTYTPHIDGGDHVIIINADKATLSGNKMTQKYYYRHSGWVGGLRKIRYDRLMETRPELAMTLAVRGMLPSTVTGRKCETRLRVYQGADHKQEAQNPQVWEVK